MADIQPLRALHYDPAVAGPLADLVAPPYDVIDADQRAELAARSPHNVVEIDLPERRGPLRDGRRACSSPGRLDGVLVRDPEPALWALEQRYRGPDGAPRTRRGFFARVRVEEYGPGPDPPARAHAPRPKEDRLRLTRATRANLSPIFSLYSDPARRRLAARSAAAHRAATRGARSTDADGTLHRLWRVGDPAAIAAVQRRARRRRAADRRRPPPLRDRARLRRGDRRRGRPPLRADVPRRARGPRPHGLPDPPARARPRRRAAATALAAAIERDFDIAPRRPRRARAARRRRTARARLPRRPGALRLTLRDQAIADAALADMPPAYRQLDTGVLEALLLKGALGLTDDDISHLHGLGYARDADQALALIDSGAYDIAFLMRPTPVEQVREIAAAGVTCPPSRRTSSPSSSPDCCSIRWRRNGLPGVPSEKLTGDRKARTRCRPPLAAPPTSRTPSSIRDHQLTVDEPRDARRRGRGPQPGGAARGEPRLVHGDHDGDVRAAQGLGHRRRRGRRASSPRPSAAARRSSGSCCACPRTSATSRSASLRVIAAKCPIHRTLDGEVMFTERVERVKLTA